MGEVGQFAAGPKAYIKFKIVNPNGSPVSDQKFYFDFLPDQKYQPAAASDSRNEAHFSRNTDSSGIVDEYIWTTSGSGENGFRYLVSVTPLFDSPTAPKNKAIIWQVPMRFDPDHNTTVTLVNVPGGGLDSGANVVPPTPKPAAPSPGYPGGPEDTEGGVPVWAWVALGLGVAAAVYFFVLPTVFGKDE